MSLAGIHSLVEKTPRLSWQNHIHGTPQLIVCSAITQSLVDVDALSGSMEDVRRIKVFVEIEYSALQKAHVVYAQPAPVGQLVVCVCYLNEVKDSVGLPGESNRVGVCGVGKADAIFYLVQIADTYNQL